MGSVNGGIGNLGAAIDCGLYVNAEILCPRFGRGQCKRIIEGEFPL
ncbi:hypothetical protein ACN6MT_05275 [Neobacillus niacini]